MSARRGGRARELRHLVIGVALLAAVLEGQQLFGMITSDDRLDPALRDARAPVDVVVLLPFQLERFHSGRLAK
jgi:hypothetical protein